MEQAARASCWLHLCDVDVAPLAAWLPNAAWPPVKCGQPNRVRIPDIAQPIINQVLGCFAGPVTFNAYTACVSRIIPGRGFGYHQDPQPPEWITRVHIPIVTNAAAWFMWEEADGVKVHFEAGRAYSFNTMKRHAFANDGETDRVHLLFDVQSRPN